MQELIIGEGLRLNAIRCPNKEALIYLDRRYTYQQLNERVNRLANALTARGFKKGDKIAVLLHNCNEYLEIFLALAKTGVLTVPLTYRAVPDDWEYMINFSDASGLFFEKEFEEVVKGIRPKLSQVRSYFGVGPEKIDWAEPYDALIASGSGHEPGVEIHETDPAWISFTSGTTGRPKGCVGCHRGWVLQMPITCLECDIRQTDIFLNTGPIYHLAPYWMCLLNLYIGTTLITMREFDALETLKFIDREKVNGMFMVPTMFNMILNLPEEAKKGWDLTSLRVISSGAAPLLTKTKEETLKFFPNASLYEFYSASELGIATNLRPEDQMRKVRCCGKPFTGVEIKLLDEEGREVKAGEVGELYMKGFNTFKEYYKNPQATADGRRGEFTTVGDMARVDEEGYYYIVDRKKDMVISGGVNIYPIEIDEVIQKHPKVLEVAVVGVPDETWGESLKAVVVLKRGETATEEEILGFCQGKLARFKIPRSVDFVSQLPRTPSGKVQKVVIRQKYWEGLEAKV